VIRADSAVLAVAGGGGGGGAGSVRCPGGAGGDGGSAGTAGTCSDGGAGGSGSVPEGTGPLGAGGRDDAGISGVAGGGGGGGLDGALDGGGRGGAAGDLSNGGGGGGGGAGGPSFAVDPSATFDVAPASGDGWVKIDWTPGLSPASTVSAPDSVQQGSPATLVDVVAPPRQGLPEPTGTVTFDQVDPATKVRTVLGTADVSNGQATLSADLAGVGPQSVQAFYSGDSTYFPSTSGYALTTVVPTSVKPVVAHVSPASGPRRGGTLVTITGRNFTGVTAIRIGSAAMKSVSCSSSTTCTAITPRGTVGVKNIRVVTAGGTSALVTADRFTYR
jgi:hypothetical protein